MQTFWPYISFIFGAIFALVLQWVSYRLSFRKDQRREYWIRKLNSYQDFYHHTTQLIGLLNSKVSIPENVYWQSISLARKAAYDATFYDRTHPERTEKMKVITLELIKLYNSNKEQSDILSSLAGQVDGIIEEFYKEEKLLTKKPQFVKDEQIDSDNDTFIWTLVLGGFVSGIVYIALFFPLAWHSAKNIGLNPIDVIFFAQFPPELSNNFFGSLAPAWSKLEARPILYSFGVLYGIMGILLAYMLFSFKINGLGNFVVTANGLFWGYLLTIYLAGNIFGIIQIDLVTQKMIHFKIAYIFFAYYFFEGMKDLMRGKGLLRKKYEIFYDGMFGIVSTLLILKGFYIDVVSTLTGPLFLSCTFLTILVAEQTIGRFIFAVANLMKINEKEFEKMAYRKGRKLSLAAYIWQAKKFSTYLWQKIKEYKGQEIELPFFPVRMRSIIKDNSKRTLILKESLICFVIFSIFPVLALTIYHFVLERHL